MAGSLVSLRKVEIGGIFIPDDCSSLYRIEPGMYFVPYAAGGKCSTEFTEKLEALIEEYFYPVENIPRITFCKGD